MDSDGTEGTDEEPPEANDLGPSVCMAHGCRPDRLQFPDRRDLVEHVWVMSEPPRNLRQLQRSDILREVSMSPQNQTTSSAASSYTTAYFVTSRAELTDDLSDMSRAQITDMTPDSLEA